MQIKYETPSQPRQVRLDTTTNCNAICPSCHRYGSDRKGTMSKKMAILILEDIAKWDKPLNEIVPVNYGEFFLYEHWQWLIYEIAKRLPKTRIVIPTNGSMIDKDLVMTLIKIPTISVINFSVNAYFRETYTQFMGFSQTIMDSIKEACVLLKLYRPDITLWTSMVFDPKYQTDYEMDCFKQYWSQYAIPQIIHAASAGRNDNQPLHKVVIPCRSIFSDFVIGFDGKLSSCCFDAGFKLDIGYYSGNVINDWTNDKIELLRSKHNDNKRSEYALCAGCSFA
jgi:uncharacterized Fe-S cluster-containing radical SAM superfamily protein